MLGLVGVAERHVVTNTDLGLWEIQVEWTNCGVTYSWVTQELGPQTMEPGLLLLSV